jgi:hypothetical protein
LLLSSSAPNLARIRERLFKERVLQMRAMRRGRLRRPMKEESVRVERKEKKVTSEALEAAKWGVTSLEGRKY